MSKGANVPMSSRLPLVAAAGAYASATAVASVVAARCDVPGEPFGVTVPWSVPTALLAGWGGGIAAPWPMPVVAVTAATFGRGRTAALTAGTIGAMCLAGHAIEPVTWGRRQPVRGAVATAMAASLAGAAALAATGFVRYRSLRPR